MKLTNSPNLISKIYPLKPIIISVHLCSSVVKKSVESAKSARAPNLKSPRPLGAEIPRASPSTFLIRLNDEYKPK